MIFSPTTSWKRLHGAWIDQLADSNKPSQFNNASMVMQMQKMGLNPPSAPTFALLMKKFYIKMDVRLK